jgi:hypothetical protein
MLLAGMDLEEEQREMGKRLILDSECAALQVGKRRHN